MSLPEKRAKATILVVDDDAVSREFMLVSLEDAGFNVITASDGETAYLLCTENLPDFVITDVLMPGVDGFQLCQRLRQRAEHAYLPILLATGLDDLSSIAKAFEVGATDFINKPINWTTLKYRVQFMLRANGMARDRRDHRDAVQI